MATHFYCSTASPDWKEFRSNYNTAFYDQAKAVDDGQTLYINVRYVSLFNTPDQKVTLAQVQAAHRVLNEAYRAENKSEIDMIPNTTLNPWKPLLGNPNIQFLPLDPKKVTVDFKQVDVTELDATSPVDHARQLGGVTPEVLNVYFGNGAKGILGQAYLGNQVVYNHYKSVGGPEAPGLMAGYDIGKTLIHEVGHALSLPHIFADDRCDNQKVQPDIPEQIAPNFDTVLYTNASGQWEQKGDHRDLARNGLSSGGDSCLSLDSKTNEQGINYMDYGKDKWSLMFSKSQALKQRSWLTSPANVYLKLQDAPADANSSSDQTIDNPTSGVVTPVNDDSSAIVTLPLVDTTPDPSDETPISSSAWAGIALGIVAVVVTISFFIYWYIRRNRPENHPSTRSVVEDIDYHH